MSYRYQIEVTHQGLNKYRIVRGSTRWETKQKADSLLAQWNEQWARVIENEQKRAAREARIQSDEDAVNYALERTKDDEKVQSDLDKIFTSSLSPISLDFEKLKDRSVFAVPMPELPSLALLPREPQRNDKQFNPKPSFPKKISKSKRKEFEESNLQLFIAAHYNWEKEIDRINEWNAKLQFEYKQAIEKWQKEWVDFKNRLETHNREVDTFKQSVFDGEKHAVERYFSLILESTNYPFEYDKEVAVEYHQNEKRIIVEINLPLIQQIPNRKSLKFVKSKGEYSQTYYSDAHIKSKYDSVIYQIVLQTMNYCFICPYAEKLVEAVVVNGRLKTIDRATGNQIEPCILSVSVSRNDFCSLNLSEIDPRVWFKSSRGVSAASLSAVTPVAPIVSMTREDKRFIDAYSVADDLSDGYNIAAMPWQDFENLVRELFEKEFSTNGGEVKITQASRDGGVDAIAFDPDRIRGGKIIIQAKRYTNTVGVSAVRDLYGTVLHEGAMKGILITTSNYGNDAYDYANGKPLTLMNGANLLHLMEGHGYKAKIDLQEAKKLLNGE